MNDEMTKHRVLVGPLHVGKKGKKLRAIFRLNEDGLVEDFNFGYSFPASKLRRRIPGGVYEIDATENLEKVRLSGWIFIEPYRDENKRLELELQHEADKVQEAADKAERGSMGRGLRDALRPIRWIYRDAGAQRRVVIEALVLKVLRGD